MKGSWRWPAHALRAIASAFLIQIASAADAAGPTPEQLSALRSLDAAIARFDADLARVTDAGERTRVAVLLDLFKSRRDAMRTARFDQVRYDELRFDLNVEYQRLGRYLAPPNTPASPAEKAAAADRKTIVVPDLDLVLLPVVAGTFVMGQPQGTASPAAPDEAPPTRVNLTKPFWLGATEVTVGQWRRFVDATGHRTEAERSGGLFVASGSETDGAAKWERRAGASWRNPGHTQTDRHPVVGIGWDDAQAFCVWLTARERAAGRLPAGYNYSLPTEAQWEYACRAGNRGPDPDNLEAWAWHAGNSGGAPHETGTRRPNPWGFFDLQGNVWEWCLDWHGAYPGGMVADPRGAGEGAVRVNRGGSARSPAAGGIRSTRRWSTPGPPQRDDLGFRVALVAGP